MFFVVSFHWGIKKLSVSQHHCRRSADKSNTRSAPTLNGLFYLLDWIMAKKLTTQFWIGNVESRERFYEFVAENEDADDLIPLSNFAASQNETWYDHDFFEAGFSKASGSILKKFGRYSYAKQWAEEIEKKMSEHNIQSINAFIMIGIDKPPDGSEYRQIENPCSHSENGIDLTYIGEITHDDE